MKNKPGEALLIDTGSPEHLCGDGWLHRQQAAAQAAGRPAATYKQLAQPLEMSGIGEGTQRVTHEVRVQARLPRGSLGIYEAQAFPKSDTPALLGLKSLTRGRALIDCYNKKLYHIGPEGYNLQLSPGSARYSLEESQYGHLMLPCSEFTGPSQPATNDDWVIEEQETMSMPRCEPTAVYSGRGVTGAAKTSSPNFRMSPLQHIECVQRELARLHPEIPPPEPQDTQKGGSSSSNEWRQWLQDDSSVAESEIPAPEPKYTQKGGSSSSSDWRQWRAAEPEGPAGGTRQ